MSKISRIRILNLNYNNNTIKIDDETFDLGGQNTLISLRNGGGKSDTGADDRESFCEPDIPGSEIGRLRVILRRTVRRSS